MYKLSKLAGSVIVATAALGVANAALADGYSAPKVRYERPSDWSGVYFGLHSGYQWSSLGQHDAVTGLGTDTDYASAVAGGHIGIQHQFGNVVLGVEGNFDSMFRDKAGSATCPNPTLTCGMTVDDILSVGGRAGWAAGHWMPYVTGGYANAALHVTASDVTPFPFLTRDEVRSRNNGWYIGGGFEWIVSPGWTVGVEYRHYEFDTKGTAFFTAQPTQGQFVENIKTDATSDSIMSRVTWKFGRDYGTPLK